jgi:valyl-tRNA synthetase
VQETIRTIRNLRAEAKLPPGQKLPVSLFALNSNAAQVLESGQDYLIQLANLAEVTIHSAEAVRPGNSLSTALLEVEVFLPLEGLVDKERESARLQKELDGLNKDLNVVEKKLSNPQFTDKAPAAVVEKEQAKQREISAAITKLSTRLSELGA